MGRLRDGRGGGLSPTTTLTLYVGRDCHLCEIARSELARLQAELGFEVDEIDITGVPELEQRYREWLPVIELDGERLSVYRVEEDVLREPSVVRLADGRPAKALGTMAERCCIHSTRLVWRTTVWGSVLRRASRGISRS